MTMAAYQPLAPAVFHILLALADGEKHGYRIMKSIEDHTEGALRMGAGTLYSNLQRLTETGWVAEVTPPRAQSARDERRRFYRLSNEGRQALGVEVRRLESLVHLAKRARHQPRTTSR
jgi:DNA-binding PadR family transcriptional regulator